MTKITKYSLSFIKPKRFNWSPYISTKKWTIFSFVTSQIIFWRACESSQLIYKSFKWMYLHTYVHTIRQMKYQKYTSLFMNLKSVKIKLYPHPRHWNAKYNFHIWPCPGTWICAECDARELLGRRAARCQYSACLRHACWQGTRYSTWQNSHLIKFSVVIIYFLGMWLMPSHSVWPVSNVEEMTHVHWGTCFVIKSVDIWPWTWPHCFLFFGSQK
jgi:hypothetical protein